jgi:nucleoside-diphosphate-sugar epimerase
VIRWIDDTLGTAAFEDPATAGYDKLDVRELVDGSANKGDTLRERIATGLSMLDRVKQLVVCCDYGISRSNTIAAAILARRDGLSFDESIVLVQQRVKEIRMDYGIVETVRATFDPDPLPPLNQSRVIVTGGTGFLGQWLTATVDDSLDLLPLGSQDIDLTASPYELDAWVRKHRPGAIIHLANPRIYHTHEVVAQSLAMLRNVADVCGQHGVFLVFPSSWIVFSGRRDEGDLSLGDDETPLPYGNYAMAKTLCEHLVGYLRQSGRLQAAVLRLTTLYGPGSLGPRFLFRTADHCRAEEPLVTHFYQNGRPKLQLLHAQDAARALMFAAERKIEGTFNIGGNEARSTHDLARLIAKVLGASSESQEVQMATTVANVILETAKANKVLDWEPQIGLEEGFSSLFPDRPLKA